jgi:hypothetical protein
VEIKQKHKIMEDENLKKKDLKLVIREVEEEN